MRRATCDVRGATCYVRCGRAGCYVLRATCGVLRAVRRAGQGAVRVHRAHAPWLPPIGPWALGVGPWELEVGPWELGLGSWELRVGSWEFADVQKNRGRRPPPLTGEGDLPLLAALLRPASLLLSSLLCHDALSPPSSWVCERFSALRRRGLPARRPALSALSLLGGGIRPPRCVTQKKGGATSRHPRSGRRL